MRQKHPLSEKVIALRGAIGKTQSQFAEILGTSIVTVARYETSNPPSGITLLQLADIADRHDRKDLSAGFRAAFWQEVADRVGGHKGYVTYRFSTVTGDGGYLVEVLKTPEEYAYAQAFQHGVAALRKGGREASRARKALRDLFDALIPADERQFFETTAFGVNGHQNT